MVDALITPSLRAAADTEVSFATKIAFLSTPGALPGEHAPITRHETHMSWLFFGGEAVYKLKKPVRLPYLDFSTLARRKVACEAEFRLNQHLAPGVYRAVLPLVRRADGLRLGGPGEIVDWVVEMRRLDQRLTLEARLQSDAVGRAEVDALAARLAEFYAHAPRPRRSTAQQLANWRALLALNRRVLLDPTLGMPGGVVRHVLAVQARFLRRRADLVAARVRAGQLVDAHGDLRPEHIWMGPPILVIDRLEFSAELRCVDWLDELSFLEVESQRLGAGQVGARIRHGVCARLRDRPPEPLRLFYASMRAMLRARLAIAHLLEPNPRTPEKWPRQAREYLAIAARHAAQLKRLLRTPEGQ
jgi:aminoglycoside phosphotransferase family enzyme